MEVRYLESIKEIFLKKYNYNLKKRDLLPLFILLAQKSKPNYLLLFFLCHLCDSDSFICNSDQAILTKHFSPFHISSPTSLLIANVESSRQSNIGNASSAHQAVQPTHFKINISHPYLEPKLGDNSLYWDFGGIQATSLNRSEERSGNRAKRGVKKLCDEDYERFSRERIFDDIVGVFRATRRMTWQVTWQEKLSIN